MKLESILEFCFEFVPEAPDTEVGMPGSDVVQQNDSTAADLRKPGREIVLHRFVGVQAVDVQKIDRLIAKLCHGIIKAHAQQIRKLPVVELVVAENFFVNFFAVESGVFIALPVVDGIAKGAEATFLDGLAKGEIRFAPVGAELDDQGRLRGQDEIVGKGKMT